MSDKEENEIPIEIKSEESESTPQVDEEIIEEEIEENQTEDIVEELK